MSDAISIWVNYFRTARGQRIFSHSYQEAWAPVPEMFCPNCGVKAVWHEQGEGDYYGGAGYLCAACSHSWLFYSEPSLFNGDNSSDIQRLDAIRRADPA